MYQAIQTKFIPVTDTRPSRVKAWAQAGSVTLSWDDSLNVDANHARVALALAAKMQWDGKYIGGALPGRGYAFVASTSRMGGAADVEFEVQGDMRYLRGLVDGVR